MLRDAMHGKRQSFKQALNDAVRAGLSAGAILSKPSRFVVKARPMGLRPGLDPVGFNKLADDLEVDALLAKRKPKRQA